MRIQEIQKKAGSMGIRVHGKKKGDLIREIQTLENNIPCFGSGRIETCEEHGCLWREDCSSVNGSGATKTRSGDTVSA